MRYLLVKIGKLFQSKTIIWSKTVNNSKIVSRCDSNRRQKPVRTNNTWWTLYWVVCRNNMDACAMRNASEPNVGPYASHFLLATWAIYTESIVQVTISCHFLQYSKFPQLPRNYEKFKENLFWRHSLIAATTVRKSSLIDASSRGNPTVSLLRINEKCPLTAVSSSLPFAKMITPW